MSKQATLKATGRRPEEWFDLIRAAGKGSATHKQIADYLHEQLGVSYWWAQEITVEYEKHIGRRIPGQTQDGLFQIGVSKTLPVDAEAVWGFLESPQGLALVTSRSFADAAGCEGDLATLEGASADGVAVETTTYEHGSHVRMRWGVPEWDSPSILQIRVTQKGPNKTTLSFHQEKLPTASDREAMRGHWREAATAVAEAMTSAASATIG